MTNFREILDQLDIATTATSGPGGAGGEWLQLLAAFGQRGFLRALTDGEALTLECAPPAEVAAARHALEARGWEVAGDAVPFIARRDAPEGVDEMRALWLAITKLADATRAEDGAAFLAAFSQPQPVDVSAPASEAASPFESIGGGPLAADAQSVPCEYALKRVDEEVHVALGFKDRIDRVEHDALEARLVSNLRAKYDVDVKAVGVPEIEANLPAPPATRVSLKVTASVGTGLSVRQVEESVADYLDTLRELSAAGVDPLVFLGIRASRRNTGAFEAIGTPTSSTPAAAASEVELSDVVLDAPADDENEVVFAAPPTEHAPLEAGFFEDERLKRLDATTALVDVVLRHPGYSDRNIAQVLSILLSIEYASCLDIAARAPTILTWGVARERALTMKTVIEGAGGRVVLVEPGTFGEN